MAKTFSVTNFELLCFGAHATSLFTGDKHSSLFFIPLIELLEPIQMSVSEDPPTHTPPTPPPV